MNAYMLWKTLAGRLIYAEKDLQIFDNFFFRWLTFGNDTIQTIINKFFPEKNGLAYIPVLTYAVKTDPGLTCLLGLGGGGICHYLRPFLTEKQLIVVEYDENVIRLAYQFFKLATLTHLTVIHQEASAFMAEDQELFQHILVDLYEKNTFPKTCFNEEFFTHCQNKLSPGGLLAVNIVNLR